MNIPTPIQSGVLSPSVLGVPRNRSHGSSNQMLQLDNHRLGAALFAAVAQKQGRPGARDDNNDNASSSKPLRGGGNVNSAYPEYIWEDEEIRRLAELGGATITATSAPKTSYYNREC
ncbi:hypothetical protein CLCR_06448 [Cladophialophora carrionii]|uniref:Uncharacterized protein n=1 Tax=Cladophialophora carrionii TaxID=86049 RepID=A0A1C1C808_9EURO|nr:hypothetical protein CLCR_06448 [Cladophialophora carrionii]